MRNSIGHCNYIDLHIHGLGRCDLRDATPEKVLLMARELGKQNVTAFLPTLYPDTIERMRANMQAIEQAMEQAPANSARILGVHLEGPFVNPKRCGALSAKVLQRPTLRAYKELTSGFERIIKIITLAPELPGALKVIARACSMGIRVSMGHSEATWAQGLEARRAGASGVTHLFNAMPGLHHREPGLVGLGLMDEELYVEVIADGVHVSTQVLSLIHKLKRPDRVIVVSDSVAGPMKIKGVLQGGKAGMHGAVKVLEGIGASSTWIKRATSTNAARYIDLDK